MPDDMPDGLPAGERPIMHFELEGREYRVDRLMLPEARAIQRVSGKTLREVMDGADNGDMEDLAALLWVIFKRQNPTLTWEQMDEPGGPGDVDLLTFKRLGKNEDDEDDEDQDDEARAQADATRTLGGTPDGPRGGPQGNGRPGSRRKQGAPRTAAGR